MSVSDNVAVACLSHGLQKKDKIYQFSGYLDQDIVLTVASHAEQPHIIQALHGDYPCGLVVLPPSVNDHSEASKAIASIVVLVDCSGSMGGLSMQQTRAGLSALLTDLPEGSEVSLMCFGSSVMHVTTKPLVINAKNRKVLLDYISNIEADMGGTELWDALRAAQAQCKKHQKTPEIVLLTDGQVWESTDFFSTVHARQKEQSRINTIGIGSAVSEDIVIRLAEATHGQWTLVHPSEPMDERICHFIAQVSAPRIACLWEANNAEWHALPPSSSEVHGAMGFLAYPPSAKEQEVVLNNVRLHKTTLTEQLASALQTLVGQQHVRTLDESEAVSLSVQLGLINQHTSFVMVHEQSIENADGLPTLAVVPQMTVNDQPELFKLSTSKAYACHSIDFRKSGAADGDAIEYLSIPLFLRREAAESPKNTVESSNNSSKTGLFKKLFSKTSPEHALLTKVDKKLSRPLSNPNIPTLEQLIKWGLDNDIAESIKTYLIQYRISEPRIFIAQVLLWLNDEQNILSAASVEILTDTIAESSREETDFFNAFIDELDVPELSSLYYNQSTKY